MDLGWVKKDHVTGPVKEENGNGGPRECFMGKLRTSDSILRWEMAEMFWRRVTSSCS